MKVNVLNQKENKQVINNKHIINGNSGRSFWQELVEMSIFILQKYDLYDKHDDNQNVNI